MMDPPPIRVELGDHSPKLSLSWRRDLNVRTDHLADEGTEIDQITSPPSYQETDHCGGSNERAVVKSDLKYQINFLCTKEMFDWIWKIADEDRKTTGSDAGGSTIVRRLVQAAMDEDIAKGE